MPMVRRSPLDDARHADHAWRRFRRILKGMGWFTLAVVAVVTVVLYREFGLVSIHLYIATALGVGLTMMLAAALMGLIFLSSGTGHDETIVDPFSEDPDAD